ncbi:chemotaxis protein CheB [Pontibacter diazotrophicus]|uniref:protein-glutamate methylesterase n=1 Tax=Pontibacter diazotrophicus TaxID=1400979 RepID=A0A3D8LAX3_9BACT|nr:chemotaxis protein CheB [Pontibacter diazotrophicus]RDV14474.1 chemotaxis protein CheB [Pontibacter diazotrophicus]
MTHNSPKIIVIGTSAGGMQALTLLLSKLPAELPAALFIVQHLSKDSSATFLVKRLSQYTKLTCKVAEHKQLFEAGTVYLAPPDMHLLLTGKEMLVTRGPRENQFRPSIDPLFRSAAAYHGASVTGVVLTGFMSDGVVGMESIKRSGGATVVQAPDDAEFPALPNNVIRQIKTDYVVPISDMGEILVKLANRLDQDSVTVPTDVWQEAQIAERVMNNSVMTSIEELEKAGSRSPYSCPECGGGLWELSQQNTIKRFRCHSGHAYTKDSLLDGISNALEETLWVALRTLEERRNILMQMSQVDNDKGNRRWATVQEERAEEMKVHVERLRELLTKAAVADEDRMHDVG